MKTNIRSIFLLLSATIIGMILFGGATAPAATFTQTANEFSSPPGGDWYGVIWSSGATATSGNDYISALIGTGAGIRTPNVTTNFAFGGDSLQITNGAVLMFKHASCIASANVILDGGQIAFRGAGGSGDCGLAGTLRINLNPNTAGVLPSTTGTQFYNLGQDQTAGNSRNIALFASLSGNGNIIMNMNTAANTLGNNIVKVMGTNTAYSGNWTNNNGVISAEGACVNPFGSGVVVSTTAGAIMRFNTTNNLVISNSIVGLGPVIQINTNVVTLTSTNLNYIGATIISNGVLQIGAGVSLANSSVISLAGGVLDESANGGLVLNVASNQQMNCNGSIISNLTASSSGSLANILNFNLTPSTNDILNVSGSLTLFGTPNITLTLSGSKPNGTYRLINYSGTIQGGGSFTVTPPVGSGETFTLNTNTTGQVNLVVTGAAVHNLDWVGGVSGDWDLTTANWSGDATLYTAGDNVTFSDAGSTASPINFVANVAPTSVTVNNTTKQYVFGVFSGGTQPGIITSGSLTKKGANELVFATTGNNISGPIDIQAGTLTIGGGGIGGSLGTGSITNNGILQVNLDGGAVAFNSPISGSGSLNITDASGYSAGATATIGGNGHNSYTGLTTIGQYCQLNIATSNALGSASSGTTVLSGGRLGVASLVGAMIIAEPVTINGPGLSGTPFGALYVNNPANNITWAGPITVASDSTIRGIGNSRMNFSNAVVGVDVALTCDAGDPNVPGGSDASTTIFFENNVSLGGSGSMTMAGVGTVIIDGATNVWGGSTAVNLGTLRVGGTLNGGNVTIGDGANFATLAGTGTILNPVTVMSGSLLLPGNFTTPIGTLTVSNSVTLNAGSTNLFELDRSLFPNSSRVVANSLSIDTTDSGVTLRVVNTGAPVQAGDTFTLFSVSGSKTGSFAVTNLPALSSTNLFWITTNLNNGVITVGGAMPTPTPFTNSVVRIVGTNVVFDLAPSGSGLPYVVQMTTSLTPPVIWVNMQTNIGTGGTISFTNPIPLGTPQRFFRTFGP